MVGQAVAEPVAVGRQAAHRGDDEEGREDVQQGRPGHHESQAVEGEQQPGQAADQRGLRDPADQPDGDEDQQRAEDQRGEPPAEGVHPEQRLAESDQPLADRRVHDERLGVQQADVGGAGDDLRVGVAPPLPLVAELEQRVAVLGVVGLVEDQLVGIAEVDHPGDEGDGGDHEGDHPADDLVRWHRDPEPLQGGRGKLRLLCRHRCRRGGVRGVAWFALLGEPTVHLENRASHPAIVGVTRGPAVSNVYVPNWH